MKKYLLILCSICVALSASAETMKFVTMLAQPVGTFARVDTTDSNEPTKLASLSFCTTSIDLGTINAKDVTISGDLTVESGATLTTHDITTVKDIDSLNIYKNTTGTFVGGSLEVNRATIPQVEVTKTMTVSDGISTKTASLSRMNITNTAIFTGGGRNVNMSWTQINAENCMLSENGDESACYALVLHSDLQPTPDDPCNNDTYRSAHKLECCQNYTSDTTICYELVWKSYGGASCGPCSGGGCGINTCSPYEGQSTCSTRGQQVNCTGGDEGDFSCSYNYECSLDRKGW